MFYISGIEGNRTLYTPPVLAPQLVVDAVNPIERVTAIGRSEVAIPGPNILPLPPTQIPPSSIAFASTGLVSRGATSKTGGSEEPLRKGPEILPVSAVDFVSTDFSLDQRSPEARLAHTRNPYAHLDEANPIRERAIVASQIMSSNVVTASGETTVEQVLNLFQERHFRHVPILSKEGKLIGIVSDRDIFALSLAPVTKELSQAQRMATPIKEVMTINVLTTRPSTEIRFISRIMVTEQIRAMPVVDDHGSLTGIVTTTDILRTLVNQEPLELWT